MKKFLMLMMCVVFLGLMAMPATADNNTQLYNLGTLGDDTLAFTAENAPAFWERPTLKAGEYTTTAGTLTVRNSTTTEQKIGLRTVELPYDNEEALRYLNHVYVTVRDGDTVLYEGAYSGINDDRDFTLNTLLPANAQITYSIDLRCDYTYAGEGLAEDDLIEWEFYAVTETANETESTPFSDQALLEVLLACGIAAVLLVGVFLYDRFVKNRR